MRSPPTSVICGRSKREVISGQTQSPLLKDEKVGRTGAWILATPSGMTDFKKDVYKDMNKTL